MKYLKSFENRAYGSNYVSILDEDIEKYLPKKMDIYTMGGGEGGGNYELELDAVTRETDILRVPYTQNTPEEVGGDVLADGEPDTLEYDMHFITKDGNLKINVDVTYGDSMISSFSLERPDKLIVNHYTGLGSHIDPETHFGICGDSIKELVKFFNRFGFQLHEKDFSFLDKYPETYVHEGLRLTPLSGDKKILLINNAKPQENRYFKNLQKWCQNRGIQYVSAISDRDVERICQNENIVGVILSGSDFRITKPIEEVEGAGSRKALEILTCPILGICYGFQTMAKFHGAQIEDGGKFHLDNLVLTESDASHPLFKGVHLDNTEFSFAYNDIVKDCPEGFKVIAKIDDTIAGIANDNKKRFGLLFHPEDIQRTYQVLDNFVSMFDNVQRDQDALKIGKFQYLESYNSFVNELNQEGRFIRDVFDDVIEELEKKNFEVKIGNYDSRKDAHFFYMPDIVLNIRHSRRTTGEQFDYNQELYDLLIPYLRFIEDPDVLLVGTEYEYLQNFKMGGDLHQGHFDQLLDMKDYKHYIIPRSINGKLCGLKLYFRFEDLE